MKLYITLKELKAADPCREGWKKLRSNIEWEPADEVRIKLEDILWSNGPDDCEFALDALGMADAPVDTDGIWMALDAARRIAYRESVKAFPDPLRPSTDYMGPGDARWEEYWKDRDEAEKNQGRIYDKVMRREWKKILKGAKRA